MSKFNVGDRVSFEGYDSFGNWQTGRGIVREYVVAPQCVAVRKDFGGLVITVPVRACRRLKPKAKRRSVSLREFLGTILHGNEGHRQWLTDAFTKTFGPDLGEFVEKRKKKV